jgi:hypothetical protein
VERALGGDLQSRLEGPTALRAMELPQQVRSQSPTLGTRGKGAGLDWQ